MKRCALMLVCALIMAGSGCCLCPFSQGCGPYGYGAGYAPFGGAFGGTQQYNPACPTGNCGPYPQTQGVYPGAYAGSAPVVINPYGYPVTATLDPLPVY